MTEIILNRDKHIIYITRPDSPIKLLYDLKEQRMKKFMKREKRYLPVIHQYKFFENIYIDDLKTNEEHFKEMILLAKKINPNCGSLSTFFSRLNSALVYENYIQEGIKTESFFYHGRCSSKYVLTKPLNFYTKNVIKFFKKYDIEVSTEIENNFVRNYKLMENLVNCLENSELEVKDKVEFFRIVNHIRLVELRNLVELYHYDLNTLINYLYNYLMPFENLDTIEGLRELDDYYRMVSTIGRDMKKYPKYLRSMHDIIIANYRAYKKDYDELKFERITKKELEYEDKVYCVIVPTSTKDIIAEGTANSNCVASYLDKILKEETYLMFMRLKEEMDKSLITLEYKQGKLVQMKGAYNRACSEDETKFIEKYSKIKNIPIQI